MTDELYDYRQIAQHPKLAAFYAGWLGQKICALAYLAVLSDRHELWAAAAGEVDRIMLVLKAAEEAKKLDLSGETGLAAGELVLCFTDGGWWTAAEGMGERDAQRREYREADEFFDEQACQGQPQFRPRLFLEPGASYPVAASVLGALGSALTSALSAMNALDAGRLGVELAGFCYPPTAELDVAFVNSTLKDLAAHDLTDLQAENEFRRAVGLSQLAEDRRPRSITDPGPMPVPDPLTRAQVPGMPDPFDRNLGNMEGHCDLILGCVFRRFDLAVPPAESDARRHPELALISGSFQPVAGRAVVGNPNGKGTEQISSGVTKDPGHFWIEDAARYLGADQLGVNPRKFMYRLVGKGALPKKKINGRYVFYKSDLDRVIANGDQKRRPGRPRRPHSA